jgi:hypothetical protein
MSHNNANKTRYLQIVFDQNFPSYEIPKLRAAIIEKTKRESDLFHNHLEDEKYIYRYPLIQYKIKDRKPCIICLREATEDIHYLLKAKDFKFRIGREVYDFDIEDVRLKYERIQTWDSDFRYNIHNYMALNQENFQIYKTKETIWEKYQFIEGLLQKHLNIFAEEMEANLPYPVTVKIQEIKEEKFIEYKSVFHLTFSLNFKCNLTIPDYVGIGKGVSVGFGIVKKLSDEDLYSKKLKNERNGNY